MAMTNAERQARHRERIKQKLAEAGEPLRNDASLLDRMNDAFEEAHVAAVLNKVEWYDGRRSQCAERNNEHWEAVRETLIRFPGFKPQTEEEWVDHASVLGAKLGDHLALTLIHKALSAEKDGRDQAKPPEPVRSKRKRVT